MPREQCREWDSLERVHPDCSFLQPVGSEPAPFCSQVGLVALDLCAEGDAGISSLLEAVPTHKAAPPHSL